MLLLSEMLSFSGGRAFRFSLSSRATTAWPHRPDWWKRVRVRGEDKEGGCDDMRERGRERDSQRERWKSPTMFFWSITAGVIGETNKVIPFGFDYVCLIKYIINQFHKYILEVTHLWVFFLSNAFLQQTGSGWTQGRRALKQGDRVLAAKCEKHVDRKTETTQKQNLLDKYKQSDLSWLIYAWPWIHYSNPESVFSNAFIAC